MQQYQALYNELEQRLQSTGRKERLFTFAGGLSLSLAITLTLFFVSAVIEAFLYSSSVVRTTFMLIIVGVGIASFLQFAGKSLLRLLGIIPTENTDTIALRVGKHFSEIGDKLCNVLQLYREQPVGASADLVLAAFESVATKAQPLNFEEIIETKQIKKNIILLFSVFLVASVAMGVSDILGSAAYRLWNFSASFAPPAPFSLHIQASPTSALRGEKAIITVTAKGDIPDEIQFLVREEQQQTFDSYTLRPDSTGVATFEIQALRRTVLCYAAVPWYFDSVRTDTAFIQVLDKPEIRLLEGKVAAPSYTGAAPRSFDITNADILTLNGSKVAFSVVASKNLSSANVVLLKERSVPADSVTEEKRYDTLRLPLQVDGKRAAGSFAATFNGAYYFDIADTDGQHNASPVQYSVAVLPDATPSITLVEPSGPTDVAENALLPIRVVIADDYGFSSLRIQYRLIESRYRKISDKFTPVQISFPRGERSAEVPHLWDLTTVGITPSDKYEYYIEVLDNDAVNGPKAARTQTLTVRLPSLEEIFDKADNTQEAATKELEKILADADQVRKEVEEVNRELRKQMNKQQAGWEEKKKMEEIVKKQEEFAKRFDEVKQQMEQMTEQLQEKNAVSPETLQKYMELQQLMKKVEIPQLRQASEQLRQAMEQMTPQQMQQAMENFRFNEEDFRKNIERTMKMLQRVQAEQKTDELAKRSAMLEQRQDQLQKELQNANLNDEARRKELEEKQQQLQKEMNNLQKEMADLNDLMKKIGDDMPKQEMQKALDALKPDQTQQAMNEAKQEISRRNRDAAAEKQQKAQQNLSKFAQAMQQVKKEMDAKNKQETMRQMRSAIREMLQLSKRQEELKNRSEQTDPNSSEFNKLAQEQEAIEQDLRKLANNLGELSKKSFSVTPEMGKQIGEALKKMNESKEMLTMRNTSGSCNRQGGAMGSMNTSVKEMQSELGKMSGQGQGQGQGEGQGEGEGSQGFMQQLQQMAGQQMMINQSLQQMMQGQGQDGQSGGQGSRKQAGQLASDQESVQKSIEQLAREEKESGGKKRALGDLNAIAKEMQEVVSALRNGDISPETVRRQEKILSRLLDASRSARERDYEEKRKGQAAENIAKKSPAELDLSTKQGKENALQELLKSAKRGYSKDFEALIRRYFEALRAEDVTPLR